MVFANFLPEDPADFGPAALIPAFFLIIYIFVTKRILEALTLASIMGFLMLSSGDTLGAFISSASAYMTPQLMPFIIFFVLGITEFITGTNWGMYIIALPIVIPLAMGMDANVTLAVAAVLSAGVWGSHVCFYSDATILTSAATECNNLDHAFTQAPFGFLAAVFSAIAFLIAGFLFN